VNTDFTLLARVAGCKEKKIVCHSSMETSKKDTKRELKKKS